MNPSSPFLFSLVLLTLTACVEAQSPRLQKIDEGEQVLRFDELEEKQTPAAAASNKDPSYQQHRLKDGKALWGRCEKTGPTLSKLLISKGLDKEAYSLVGSTGTLKAHLALLSAKTGLIFKLTAKAQEITNGFNFDFVSQETMFVPEILKALLAYASSAIRSYVHEESIFISTKAERDARICVYIHDVSDLEKIVTRKRDAETFSWDHSSNVGFKEARPLRELEERYQSRVQEGCSVKYSAGFLVSQLPYGQQEELARSLAILREEYKAKIVVEARFLEVSGKVLREIGAPQYRSDAFTANSRKESSGHLLTLPGQAPSIAAPAILASKSKTNWRNNVSVNKHQFQALVDFVNKTQKHTRVNAPRLTLYNGQRIRMSNLFRRAYIEDIEASGGSVIVVQAPALRSVELGSEVYLQARIKLDSNNIELDWVSTLTKEVDSEGRPVSVGGKRSGLEKHLLKSSSEHHRLQVPMTATILITDYQMPVIGEKVLPIVNSPLLSLPETTESRAEWPMLSSIPLFMGIPQSTPQSASDLRTVVLLTFRPLFK